MKKLYSFLFFLLFLNWSYTQSIQIVSSIDNQDYAGKTVEISGNDITISELFYMKNIGETNTFYWARSVVSSSSDKFLIQLCDDMLCYNTAGEYWISPLKTISNGDSVIFKPQITPKGVSGAAEVKYFVLDENKEKIDSLTVLFSSTASIDKNKNLSFNIYPNPAQDYITLQGEGLNNGGTLVFIDALGKEIQRVSIKNESTKINVSALKRGVYLVNFYDNSGHNRNIQRFIKQ